MNSISITLGRLLVGLGLAALPASAATTFLSFEDGTTQNWQVNGADWANGFTTMSVASGHATDGTKSLQIDFTGQSFKWGGVLQGLGDPSFLNAIRGGGKLILDLHVPETSAGLQHLGFVIQQPDVTGDKNWQQVWFFVGGQTGDFTVELPFERLGAGAVNLHLGQNATADQPFTVFVDNVRVEPPPATGPEPVLVQSFEDGSTQGWALNTADWANGFATLENSSAQATQGTKSLKLTFPGQSYKWGAVANVEDPAFIEAVRYGGKLVFDLLIADDSDGVQNLGFSFQQPGVEGALGWQQVWFGTGGGTGRFTVELPFQRTASGPFILNLGQNAAEGKTYTIYLDNVRVLPNAPPPQGVTVKRSVTVLSFEDDTTQGFEPNSQGWGQAFTAVEVAAENATDGSKSLKGTFAAGSFKWGAYSLNVTRPDVLAALSRNATLMVDVFIPETSTGVQHLGLVLKQANVASPDDWQQVWFFVGGKTGRFTIDLPFRRLAERSIEFHLGFNATGDTDSVVYYDNFRVVSEEIVGGTAGTVKASPAPAGKVKVEFTGSLQQADTVSGPFTAAPAGSSPVEVTPDVPARFYRATGSPIVFFTDDFEGADKGWTKKAEAGDAGTTTWTAGTPNFPDEITFAHSGTKAWTTGLDTTYGDNAVISLQSPAITLTGTAGARLSFFSLVDVGGGEGDTDKVELFVRNEAGGVLTGAENAFWTKSRANNGPWFFQQEVVDLPAAANGKKVKLEFRLTTDGNPNAQKGWLIDTVSVYAKP